MKDQKNWKKEKTNLAQLVSHLRVQRANEILDIKKANECLNLKIENLNF